MHGKCGCVPSTKAVTMNRLVLALILCAVLGIAGCSPKALSPDELAAKQKAECFKTQGTVLQAMKLFYADSGTYAPVETVVTQLEAKCPAGGTYAFDEETEKLSCSIHGSAP